jgi:paraquat-inducible protein A
LSLVLLIINSQKYITEDMQHAEESKKNQDMNLKDITVCPGCDMVVATEPLDVPIGSQLICPRCRYKIHVPKEDTINRTLALSLTGLLIFIPAHFMLLLQFEALGLIDKGTVIDSMTVVYEQKYFFVAFIILFTAVLIPFIKLLLLFIVSLGLAKNIFAKQLPTLFRWYCHIEEWGMTEVYLIGILITIIKMGHTADIAYKTGFFSFVVLSLALVGSVFTLDKHHYWDMIEKMKRAGSNTDAPKVSLPLHIHPMQPALNSGLIQCHTCHKVIRYQESEPDHALHCPRCEGIVHKRIPRSISTTWALVLTAVIFSVPANFLPIMQVDFLGTPEKSTIMDGIIYFFQTGSYGIGIVILTASILVPLFKVVGLILLLYSIHFNRWSRLTQKSVMFRFIEFVGRWSMLDIFVIALLCALVDFGFFTRITAAPAATFFTFVVLSTMFAAISFDPRILWDITSPQSEAHKE